jgi:hypothetical protein
VVLSYPVVQLVLVAAGVLVDVVHLQLAEVVPGKVGLVLPIDRAAGALPELVAAV